MTSPVPANEFVTFLQHQLPGLEDGGYQLTISSVVHDAADQALSGEPLGRSYAFAVKGDRFALSNPAATIASVFPASNATGEFATVLPHVVFNAASLPWARYPTKTIPPLPATGQDTDSDVPTWLAVLLLDEDDGIILDPVIGTVSSLYAGNGVYSYLTGLTPGQGLEYGETVDDAIQTIDIPLSLFTVIAPTLADLNLTSHVRQVSVENKPMALGAQPPDDPIGTFSIVIGNRLPQQDKVSHAYLVSLEGLQDYLPASGDGGSAAGGSGVNMAWSLRLAVLQHWTFNTKGDTALFVELLEALNGRTGTADAANTNLRLVVDGASPPISTALLSGYVPMNHLLRTAETTVSWYRGPLSPVDRARAGPSLPVASPDQALAFDPTTGMLDASLAAAWTVGRLVALQDQSFATSLYAWKRGQAQDVVDAAERQIIDDALGGLIAAPAQPAAAQPAAARPSTATLLNDTMRLLASAAPAPEATP